MSTFGNFSTGNPGGFGNFPSEKPPEPNEPCCPRESTGGGAWGAIKDLTQPNIHWYDPATGELYKDRVMGDGWQTKKVKNAKGELVDVLVKTEPWPNPGSVFGDREKLLTTKNIFGHPVFRGELKPFPPIPGVPASKLPGGGRNMCATYGIVNWNIIHHRKDLISPRELGTPSKYYPRGTDTIAIAHSLLLKCMVECYQTYDPFPEHPGKTDHFRRQWTDRGRKIGGGLPRNTDRLLDYKDLGFDMMRECKAKCMNTVLHMSPQGELGEKD